LQRCVVTIRDLRVQDRRTLQRCNRKMRSYSGFVITPQAMRAGAASPVPPATA